jgi:hypothetical protein
MSYFDWPPEDQDLAAGIIGMLTGIRLCRKHGYDPVEVCKHLSDDDIIERNDHNPRRRSDHRAHAAAGARGDRALWRQ